MSTNRIPESKQFNNEVKKLFLWLFIPEHAILAQYLRLQDKQPRECIDIDPFEVIPYEDEYNEGEKGVACRPGRGQISANTTWLTPSLEFPCTY